MQMVSINVGPLFSNLFNIYKVGRGILKNTRLMFLLFHTFLTVQFSYNVSLLVHC